MPRLLNLVAISVSHYLIAGEIGGYMGLLIGASTMTLLEVLDLVVYNFVAKCMRKGSMTQRAHKDKENVGGCEVEKS